MHEEMICIACEKEGVNTKADVEVLEKNAFDLQPGWYCSEHVIDAITKASEMSDWNEMS